MTASKKAAACAWALLLTLSCCASGPPDLSSRVGSVMMQEDSTCSGYAAAYVLKIETGINRSGLEIYNTSRAGEGGEEGGTTISAALDTLSGVLGYAPAVVTVASAKQHLDAGHPVILAVAWYWEWYWDDTDTGTTSAGYHAITLVGYDEKRKMFKYINTYGDSWAEDGYSWWSYAQLESEETIEMWLPQRHSFFTILGLWSTRTGSRL